MKIFIFTFILFATLLTVNAAPHQFNKRTTEFYSCPDGLPGVDVIMTPDPLVAGQVANFKVSGTLENEIPTGADLRIDFLIQQGECL
ncbi:phosphatidylglycerol/phosphatidylinositol transfer protein [Gigaspora margarita]|uniref:Phosphatidylglycerol/phosphatidylinositol transfer protein n=1 Tax=Gigaspora margarita TaxID=4874 RepID=A0A8H3X5P1_GIGMA|nr:phosphatidylglycerol/phosphatidylinositol transfer protein [Gigaspora margarita]